MRGEAEPTHGVGAPEGRSQAELGNEERGGIGREDAGAKRVRL